jgi:putative PEP-CTERM system TPR-repeat lipoprotein
MPHPFKQRPLQTALTSAVIALCAVGMSACSRTENTATLLADAKQYQQKGDNKAALIQLKNAVSKSPEDGEARFQLGSLHLETGDPVSAEKEIRKAMGLGIAAERTLPILAKAMLSQAQFQKLIDEITPEAAKNSAPLLALRGDAYLALLDNVKAKEAYEQALALQPASGAALIGMARYALTQKDLPAAEQYVADAVSKDPKNAEAWFFKGSLVRSQGKLEDALAAYSQVVALKPDHRVAYVEKAQVEIGLGKFDLAKADLALANKMTPGGLQVVFTQAMLDSTEGRNAEARESLQKVLRVAPTHLPSILMSGAVELRLGMMVQAEQHLRQYLNAYPDNLQARKLLAQTLLQSAKPADASAVLSPALKATSAAGDAQLYALAGESSLKSRDFSKATEYFERANALAPNTAALHTSLGISKMGEGDKAAALTELQQGATLETKSANPGIALVRAQLAVKNFDAALTAVDALEKQQPKDPQVHDLKGIVYVAKGDTTNARTYFEKAIALKPGYFPATVNLARLDIMEKKPQDAKQRFEALVANDKKNIDALTALAALAATQGNREEATSWLEKANAENPDAVAPAMRLASVYLQTKQQQKALLLLRKIQTVNPTNPDLLDLLGQAQLANNDKNGALDSYSKLVKMAPKSAIALVRLGAVYSMLDNDTAAAEHLKHAVALDPKLIPARLSQIQLAMRKKNPDEALAVAREVQKLDAKAPLGYLLEGEIQMGLNKPALALPALEKAFAQGKTAELLVKVAGAMKAAGKGKEVEARLLQWQKANPTDVMVPMYLAETSLGEKQYKVAIERFEAIVKQSPKNAVALNNLAWVYQQEKDARALTTAEQALQLAPENPAILDTIGWMLTEQGNVTRAVPLLQKAAGLAPAAAEIHYHLAFALHKSGDKANARKELDKLLSANKSFPQIDDAKALLKVL